MKHIKGFTLIEILIALTVFAILAALTSSVMYYAFNTRDRVTAQAERLMALQLTISTLEHDILQMVNRPIRGNNMQIFPAFIGQSSQLEFTRGGISNPNGLQKKSSLKRVALFCRNNQLIQRSWSVLDPINRDDFEEKILLDALIQCRFAYMNETLQILSEWQANAMGQNQNEPLPKAIRLSLKLADFGKGSFLFLIPKALYD